MAHTIGASPARLSIYYACVRMTMMMRTGAACGHSVFATHSPICYQRERLCVCALECGWLLLTSPWTQSVGRAWQSLWRRQHCVRFTCVSIVHVCAACVICLFCSKFKRQWVRDVLRGFACLISAFSHIARQSAYLLITVILSCCMVCSMWYMSYITVIEEGKTSLVCGLYVVHIYMFSCAKL